VIRNKLGLHARAITELHVRINSFESELWIEKDGERVNAKPSGVGKGIAMISLLGLAAGCGSVIEAEALGPDAEDLLVTVGAVIDDKFGENE
jgi:phosphocarrier protein HPr